MISNDGRLLGLSFGLARTARYFNGGEDIPACFYEEFIRVVKEQAKSKMRLGFSL